MKDPFEFAKDLLRYTRGELSKEEEEGIKETLSEIHKLKELAEELKDRKCIEREIHLLERFDTQEALLKVKRQRNVRKLSFIPWAAAVSVILIIGVSILLLHNEKNEMASLPMTNTIKPGKAIVTLEMASGMKYHLDTLSTAIHNNRAQVTFNNRNGILKIQEQDSFATGKVPEQDYNTITVPYGGTYLMELCDGTKVYLNSGTVFEFPSRFNGSKREVKLKGEAYFEVKRNEQQPFVVNTWEMAVKVLGTSFNVKSYTDEPGVYTTLVQGSIAILREGQPEKKIKPGEQAYYHKGVGTLSISQVDVNEFISWKDGLFYFKDIALEEILRIIARWYDLEIFYMNQGAKSVVYSGKLPMYSSVEDVLRKFEISGEVRFELKNRTLVVYDK